MKNLAKKYMLTTIGVAIGAIAGYFYWQEVGCNSNTCTITSSPTNSTIYGAFMGGLLLSIFQKDNDSSCKREIN